MRCLDTFDCFRPPSFPVPHPRYPRVPHLLLQLKHAVHESFSGRRACRLNNVSISHWFPTILNHSYQGHQLTARHVNIHRAQSDHTPSSHYNCNGNIRLHSHNSPCSPPTSAQASGRTPALAREPSYSSAFPQQSSRRSVSARHEKLYPAGPGRSGVWTSASSRRRSRRGRRSWARGSPGGPSLAI